MDKKRKHIDDFFRDKLGGYSEVPPSDAWLDMDKKLDTLTPHTPPNPYRWLGHIGIVSLIVVLGVSVGNKIIGTRDNSEFISDNNQVINKIKTSNESKTESIAAANPQQVAVPAMEINHEEDAPKSIQSISRHAGQADALAFGESYSENADNEYVEGVTEIKKEDYIQQVVYAKNRDCIAQYEEPENTNAFILNSNQKNIENQLLSNYSEKNKDANANISKTTKTAEIAAVATKIVDKTSVSKPDFIRWETGVKAGYERGFSNTASRALAVSPYVTYNICPKVGIMLQPTVKYANAPSYTIGNTSSYYQVNNDATVTAVESFVSSDVEGTTVVYYNNTRFRYTQSHDSIVKSNKTGGQYVQFELPVMMSYKINKKLMIYGGVNTVYSQLQSVSEHTYTKAGITNTAEVLVKSKATPVAPATNDVITHSGTPISEYNGPVYPANHESKVRVGAIAGVSYEYSNRWLIDAMVQKTPAPAVVKSGYNINAPLSAPSFRLSVGYKIKK